MSDFTPHQDAALKAIAKWWKGERRQSPIFRLFGYAGTGKTTLAKHIADGIDGKVLFAAFTGKAACVIRAGNALLPGQYGETQVVTRGDLDPKRVIGADQVLVGRNATRRAYNARLRERRGFADPLPVVGDKLVCLRNNRNKGLFNGALWVVKEKPKRRRKILRMRLKPDEELGEGEEMVKVSVRPECFNGGLDELDWLERKPFDEFDYGYVLTVHKAQGSQWDDVVLFDESAAFRDNRERWLYSGFIRAAKRLTVVVA